MFRSLRISHVEFDFQPRPEELGPRRNGRFFRFSGILGHLARYTQITQNFRNFWSNGKRPGLDWTSKT